MPAPGTGWVLQTEGAIALAAAGTAKTVLNAVASAGMLLMATEVRVSFDGVTASEKPILVELCRSTQAGNGTGSSAVTARQVRGNPGATAGMSGYKNYSTEPTVLTPVREWLVDPYKGAEWVQLPLGREVESLIAGGLCLRMTIPSGGAAVNARAYIEVE